MDQEGMSEEKIKKAEGFFWMAIGVLICLLALRLYLGSFREPGPGFVAFFSGLFISSVGLVMIISKFFSKSLLGNSLDSRLTFRIASWRRLLYTMMLLIAYALLLNHLGYILTTFLIMWGLFHDWEKNRWVLSFLASIVTVGVTYLVFEVWLHCQLPRGIFPW